MRTLLAVTLCLVGLAACGRLRFDPVSGDGGAVGSDGGTLAPSLDGQWTWMSGATTGDQNAVYGTKGVAAGTNAPGARDNGAFWRSGNALWMFGGIGNTATQMGMLGDLWSYDIPTGEWTWRGGSTATNDAGSFGTLGVSSASNLPHARNDPAMFKTTDTQLWMFGGDLDANSASYANDLWRLETTTGVWTWMGGAQAANVQGVWGARGVEAATNDPGSRSAAVTWPDGDGFYLYGGVGFPSGATAYEFMSDVWKYTASTNRWTWIAGPSTGNNGSHRGTLGAESPLTLPTYYGSCTFGDPSDGALWLLDTQGDVYRLDLSSTNWTWITGPAVDNAVAIPSTPRMLSATATPGVSISVNCWNDLHHDLWVQGGYNGQGTNTSTNALWLFQRDVRQWALVTGDTGTQQTGHYGTRGVADSANTPSARSNGMDWIGPDGELWLFGGDFATDTDGTSMVRMADLWRFAAP